MIIIVRCIDPHIAVQRLVSLSVHQVWGVPYEAANPLQPVQVLLVLDLQRAIKKADWMKVTHDQTQLHNM